MQSGGSNIWGCLVAWCRQGASAEEEAPPHKALESPTEMHHGNCILISVNKTQSSKEGSVNRRQYNGRLSIYVTAWHA